MEVLEATGVVDYISFGSEYEDLDRLMRIAELLESPNQAFSDSLSAEMAKGRSFPSARATAIHHALPELHGHLDMNQSNVILVIEYLKAMISINSGIKPFLVKRQGSAYHAPSLDSPFVSATAIRKAFFETPHILDENEFMPPAAYEVMRSNPYLANRIESFEEMILYAILSRETDSLATIRDVNEGLENKIKEAALKASDYASLVTAIKSKRYTMTRINRILCNLLLGIGHEAYAFSDSPYIRVLGFDGTGQKILRKIKKNTEVPIITNINKHKDLLASNPLLKLDIRATDIYHLTQRERHGGLDYLMKPFSIDK